MKHTAFFPNLLRCLFSFLPFSRPVLSSFDRCDARFEETLFATVKDRGGFGSTRVLATTAIPLGKKLRSLGQWHALCLHARPVGVAFTVTVGVR